MVLNSQDDQDEDDSETLWHPEEAEDENSDDDFEGENDGRSEFFLPRETSDEDDVEIFSQRTFCVTQTYTWLSLILVWATVLLLALQMLH